MHATARVVAPLATSPSIVGFPRVVHEYFQIGLAPSPSFHHLRPTEATSLPPPRRRPGWPRYTNHRCGEFLPIPIPMYYVQVLAYSEFRNIIVRKLFWLWLIRLSGVMLR